MGAERARRQRRKRKKRGRPKGTGGPPGLVRRHLVTASLTDAELRALTQMAYEKDLPVGTMLYELVQGRLKRRK